MAALEGVVAINNVSEGLISLFRSIRKWFENCKLTGITARMIIIVYNFLTFISKVLWYKQLRGIDFEPMTLDI
jgi:hypothetical protein